MKHEQFELSSNEINLKEFIQTFKSLSCCSAVCKCEHEISSCWWSFTVALYRSLCSQCVKELMWLTLWTHFEWSIKPGKCYIITGLFTINKPIKLILDELLNRFFLFLNIHLKSHSYCLFNFLHQMSQSFW